MICALIASTNAQSPLRGSWYNFLADAVRSRANTGHAGASLLLSRTDPPSGNLFNLFTPPCVQSNRRRGVIYPDPGDTPRFSAASRSLAIFSQASAISSVACLSLGSVILAASSRHHAAN